MTISSTRRARGFTLLELIIVIAILSVLSVAVILVINPAETLRRGRDSTRFSDLSATKSAIALYLTDVTSADLDAALTNLCLGTDTAVSQIAYSIPSAGVACATAPAAGADADAGGSAFSAVDFCTHATATNLGAVNGTGWIPVNLAGISSGSPLGSFPVDPTNAVQPSTDVLTTPDNGATDPDLMYRYACQQAGLAGVIDTGKPTLVFELAAVLESNQYKTTQDRDGTDGGDDATIYEQGTSLRLIGDSDAY